ncbi:hypothetical protein Cgig2_009460 [Carnegiea gigantea]|uniref:CRAL-TRIO domain-containing protein n=1 Tax=Carnegiea gigantea TaxID=171969 RepID=A0A9Q1QEJ7_9CARY|nr:hypothetical protein Cgig2_009460 [Carnegiea gigantea]
MGIAHDDAIKQFHTLMEEADEPLKKTFQNMHQGYPSETFVRFLKARGWNVDKAHQMLIDCLNWRVQNEIDNILATCLLQTREHLSLLPDPLLKPFYGYLCYESPFQASTTNLQVRISISLPSLLRIFLPLFFFRCFGPFCGLSVAVWLLFLLLLLFLFLFGHVCWPWWCFRPPFSLSLPPIAVGGLGGEWAASSFKPIVPAELYREVRDSQLVGMSGYSKEGLPVIAIGVGRSTFDKASVHYYVQSHIQMNEYRDRVMLPLASQKFGRHIGTCIKVLDMTGLKLSSLNQIKLLTAISTIDDLNYPEKTDTYYIVNVPYIFSACWKVVKPLLQERTRKKIQVLQGCGRDELLKIMDYASLPHFCTREGSGSSRHSRNGTSDNCFSFDHPFHQELYDYVKEQATLTDSLSPLKQGSFHVAVPQPDPEDAVIAQTIECELYRLEDRKDQNGLVKSLSKPLSELEIKIN